MTRRWISSPGFRLAVLLVAVIVLLIGAAILSVWTGLERFVALSPRPLRILWLPLLVLLLIVVCCVVRAICRLSAEESRLSKFPDIDWAWGDILARLSRAGVGIDSAPLILVLGEPGNGIDALFNASGMTFVVSDRPRRPDSPIKAYASREAIFVCCPALSVLARFATEVRTRPARPGLADEPSQASPTVVPTAANGAESMPSGEARMSPATQEPAPRARTGMTVDQPVESSSTARALRPSVLSRSETLSMIEEQLRHLCGLIVRDRRPYCPVNGILTLIPYAATDDDLMARQAGTACHLDLNTARDALGVSCPVFAMMCDMEEASFFEKIVHAYAGDPKLGLLGRSFPLVPESDLPERVIMIAEGMEWIRQALIAPLVYRLFQLEAVNKGSEWQTPSSNIQSIQFLCDTQGRWQRLGRILGRVISLDSGADMMLGGCYLAATGQTENRRGFVAGVIQTILQHQNFVAWTKQSLRQDRADGRRAVLYNAGLLCLLLFTVTAACLYWTARL